MMACQKNANLYAIKRDTSRLSRYLFSTPLNTNSQVNKITPRNQTRNRFIIDVQSNLTTNTDNKISDSTNETVKQLIEEIHRNLPWRINTTKLFNTIAQKKKDNRHAFMQKHNLALTESEFISIILWSSSELLTKNYHIDCTNNNEYKWKLFITALSNGIKKLCRAVMINDALEECVFPSLPGELYRGTTRFNVNSNAWCIETIISFTTSESVAQTFAALGVTEEQDKSYILLMQNVAKHLSTGALVAAPIMWLSEHPYEKEWIVLPGITCLFDKEGNGNLYRLTVI